MPAHPAADGKRAALSGTEQADSEKSLTQSRKGKHPSTVARGREGAEEEQPEEEIFAAKGLKDHKEMPPLDAGSGQGEPRKNTDDHGADEILTAKT